MNVVMIIVTTGTVGGRLMVSPSVQQRWSRAAVIYVFIITILNINHGMESVTYQLLSATANVHGDDDNGLRTVNKLGK